MTGETVRDLYAAVHNPITDLRLSRLRELGTLVKEVDDHLVKLELDILNKVEATLNLSLRASPPPNVRVDTATSGLDREKKSVGRPKTKASQRAVSDAIRTSR